MTEAIEAKYNTVFENTLETIELLKRKQMLNSVEAFEHTLEALYVSQGNDHYGRGALFDAMISAEIAAYELAYISYKKANKKVRIAS